MPITLLSFPDELAALKDIADHYHLVLDLSDENRALLVGGDFIISVTVDREGPRIWYYDGADRENLRSYALDFLLYRKRRLEPQMEVQYADNLQRVEAELHDAIGRLATDASDVLSGRREWFAEYTWEVSIMIGTNRTMLLAALTKAGCPPGRSDVFSPM
jgi:hypothetical protein